jgi:hypothetical protein
LAAARQLFGRARDAFRAMRNASGADTSLEEIVCDGMLGDPFSSARLLPAAAEQPRA